MHGQTTLKFGCVVVCALRLTTDHVIKENVSDRGIITAGAHHWISFQLKWSHFQLTQVACSSLLRDLCTRGSEVLCRHFCGFVCSLVSSGRRLEVAVVPSLCEVNGRRLRVMHVFLFNVFVFLTQRFLTFLPRRNIENNISYLEETLRVRKQRGNWWRTECALAVPIAAQNVHAICRDIFENIREI